MVKLDANSSHFGRLRMRRLMRLGVCVAIGVFLLWTLAIDLGRLFHSESPKKTNNRSQSLSDLISYSKQPAEIGETCLCPIENKLNTVNVRSAIVFDAGSTGTRVHIYDFSFCGDLHMLDLRDELFDKVKPGLSSYADDPKEATRSILPLMDIVNKKISPKQRSKTPLIVKATAGLRLVGETKANQILDELRSFLRNNYEYPVLDVSVMDGAEEGVFAWATINFLMGHLQHKYDPTSHQEDGVISKSVSLMSKMEESAIVMDLGGGSTQIVFSLPSAFEQSSIEQIPTLKHKYYVLRMLGRMLPLYQHSFLEYGLMEARKASKQLIVRRASSSAKVALFSCFHPHHSELVDRPNGTKLKLIGGIYAESSSGKNLSYDFLNSGNAVNTDFKEIKNEKIELEPWNMCISDVSLLFDKKKPCEREPCSFNGVHMPRLPEKIPIVAFSYFYDRLITSGLESPVNLEKIASLGKRVCSNPTSSELADNPDLCLDIAYIYSLLHNGYEMDPKRPIYVTKRINNYEAGWSLGAAINLFDRHNTPSPPGQSL